MLVTYRILALIAHPFLLLWLLWRAQKGKEDKTRLYERFGKARLARPSGKLCWIHAASVGESQSVLPLIEALCARSDSVHVLLTTGTLSSAKLMQARLPKQAMHQFVPIDSPLAVRRFLKHWKPDVALWVESELWPNLFAGMDARRIPRMLINARLSDRSYNRWQKFRPQFHQLMQPFKEILCGSMDDQKRLKRLGIEQAEYAGNLKYDVPALPYDTKAMGELIARIGDRRCWLVSSTHPGEDEQIVEAHKQLKETHASLLTIIVPRHPRRSKEIASLVGQKKLTAAIRSKNQTVLAETDVYIADTLGELGLFYRMVGIVCMGGSLVPHGGHNPIEPALLDCALVCGPHMHNFQEVVNAFKAAGGITQVENLEGLIKCVGTWLSDHEKQEAMAKRAHDAVDDRSGATQEIVQRVAPILKLPVLDASSENALEGL